MSDNPFAEPDDSDRTVVRGPVRAAPGAAAAPAVPPPPPRAPAGAPQALAGEAGAIPRIGIGPLAAAAAPLLDLLSRLSADVQVADAAALSDRARAALGAFLRDARAAAPGQGAEDVLEQAHYALCAAIDDVASASRWGGGQVWAAHSLSSELHRDVRSGEEFFVRLTRMMENPGHFRPALEVAYLCLALGMQGRYRRERNGKAELDRVRERLYQLLLQLRGAWERELSPQWRGVDAPHRPGRRGIPSWTAAALAAFVLGGSYAWLANRLDDRTDDLFARLAALPPAAAGVLPTIQRAAPPQPPAPPPRSVQPTRPDLAARLRQFLAPEIQQGLVEVLADPNRTIVRVRNRGLFASGSAAVDPRFVPLLGRIGEALRSEPGAVLVVGHSDDQPIRTARFPSNFHLSAARAAAAGAIIAGAEGGTPGRFHAEGRGEAEPIAANTTPEGREANRRIEVVIATPAQAAGAGRR